MLVKRWRENKREIMYTCMLTLGAKESKVEKNNIYVLICLLLNICVQLIKWILHVQKCADYWKHTKDLANALIARLNTAILWLFCSHHLSSLTFLRGYISVCKECLVCTEIIYLDIILVCKTHYYQRGFK